MQDKMPSSIIREFSQTEGRQMAANDEVLVSSQKLMQRNQRVYKKLAE